MSFNSELRYSCMFTCEHMQELNVALVTLTIGTCGKPYHIQSYPQSLCEYGTHVYLLWTRNLKYHL